MASPVSPRRDNQRIDANRDLVALGGANLASSLCSGMAVSGSLSKTAVNASAGARTQVSTLLHDIVVLRIESGLYFANADNVRARIVAAVAAEGVRRDHRRGDHPVRGRQRRTHARRRARGAAG